MKRLKKVTMFTGEVRFLDEGNTTVAPPFESVPPQAEPKPTVNFLPLLDEIKSPYLGDTISITDKPLEEEVERPNTYPRIIRLKKPSPYQRAANISERRRNPDESRARFLQDQQNREAEKRRLVAPTADTTAEARGPQTRTPIPQHVPRNIFADADEPRAPPPTVIPAAKTSKPESYAYPQRFQPQEPPPYSETIRITDQSLSDEDLARSLQDEEYREADQSRLAQNVSPIDKFRKLAEVFQDSSGLGIIGKSQDGEILKKEDGSVRMFPLLPNTQRSTYDQSTPLEDLDFQNETVFVDGNLLPDVFDTLLNTEREWKYVKPFFTPKNGKTYYIIAASLHRNGHYTTDMFNWDRSFTNISAHNVDDRPTHGGGNQSSRRQPMLSVRGGTIFSETRNTTTIDPWTQKYVQRRPVREQEIQRLILKYVPGQTAELQKLADDYRFPKDKASLVLSLQRDPEEQTRQLEFGIANGIIVEEEGDMLRLIPSKLLPEESKEAKTRIDLLMYTCNKDLAVGTGDEWRYNTRPNRDARCFMASLLLMMSRANIQAAKDLLDNKKMACSEYTKGLQEFRGTLQSQIDWGGLEVSASIMDTLFEISNLGDASLRNFREYQDFILRIT